MLWRTLLCCLVLAGAVSANGGKRMTQRKYNIDMRTVTAHRDVAKTVTSLLDDDNAGTGSLMKMKLVITPMDRLKYTAEFIDVRAASFGSKQRASQISAKVSYWESVPYPPEPVYVVLNENGTINDILFKKDIPYWPREHMQSIIELFNLPTFPNLSKNSRTREAFVSPPTGQDNKYSTFHIKEKSQLGECGVHLYTHPLTPVELQQFSINEENENIMVVNKDYDIANCSKMNNFTMGLSDSQELPFSRSMKSTYLIKGDLEDFTITHVEANSTFIGSPQLYNKQHFMVAVNLKASLVSETQISSAILKPQIPQSFESAVRQPRQLPEGMIPYMKYDSSEVFFPSRNYKRSFTRDQSNDWSSYVPQLPYHIANNGKRIGDGLGRNITDVLVQLVSDISLNLHIGESVSTPWILTNLIVSIKHMRTMTLEEMLTTHNVLVQNQNSNTAESKLARKVFRNIAALTGTPYSLQALFLWLEKEAISVQEFTQLFSMQREVAFIPDSYYLETLWKIAIEVEKIQHSDQQAIHDLRATVGLTFTDILRMARRQHKQLTEKVVRYYITRLEEAIKTNNNKQTQLLMRIVGNIASKDMLEPFYKIILGEWGSTETLRLHALVCLDWLTAVHPTAMTKFWVSILGNTTLPHRLRCLAVPNILKSNPPAWILQQMAQATHNETNPHVIAQVASAIRTAAQLRGPFNEELARNARAAQSLLKPVVYDASYSSALFDSYKIEGMDLSYTQLLNYIGSQDSLIPSAFQYFVNKNYNGYRPLDFQASGMVSSINDTLAAIFNTLFKPQPVLRSDNIPTEPFAGIHVPRRPKLEGNLHVPGYGFWSFDEKSLQKTINELIVNAERSIAVDTMQMSNAREIILAVPSGLGPTFVYTYTSVQLTKLKGNVWLKKHFDAVKTYGKPWGPKSQSLSANLKLGGNIDITLAKREESKMGFVTPWDAMDYISGLNINTEVHAPVDVSLGVEYNSEGNDIQVSAEVSLPKTESVNIFHRSLEPYVSKIWLLGETTTTAGNPNTTLLHVRTPITVSASLGKGSTGMAFHLDYYTEKVRQWTSWWPELYKQFKGYNLFSFIHFLSASPDIHISNLNVTYDASESTANTARFNWRFGGFPTPAEVIGAIKSQKPRYHPRSLGVPLSVDVPSQQQLAGGSSQRQALWNVTFEGETVATFGLHAALQSNLINQSFTSSVHLWSKPVTKEQFNAALELSLQVPQVSLWNFQQALSRSPNSTIEALLTVARPSWGKPAVTMLSGKWGRTPQRQEYISESPIAQTCLKQMQSGYNLLRACQEAIHWANSLDAFEFTIRHKHIPVELKRVALATYSVVRQAAFSQLQEDIFLVDPSTNTISVGLYINNQSTALNFTIQSSLVNANVTNLPIPSWAQPIIPSAGRSLVNRIAQHVYPLSYAPSFVLDNGHIITIDGKSYPWKLSTCWYIALAYTPKWQANAPWDQEQVYQFDQLEQVLLVRLTEEGYLQSKIINNNGLIVEVSDGKVYVNDKEMDLQQEQPMSIDGVGNMYKTDDDGVVMQFSNSFMDSMYQGPKSILIVPGSEMRDSSSGVVGRWNGDPEDDLLSPEGLKGFPEDWADCKRPSKQSSVTVKPHQPVFGSQRPSSVYAPHITNIFDYFDSSNEISEPEEQSTEIGYGSTAFLQGLHSTVIYQNDIQVINKRICFSINPVVKCKPNQKPISTEPNIVSYHCMSQGPEADKIKQQIERFIVPLELQSKPVSIKMPSIEPQECSSY